MTLKSEGHAMQLWFLSVAIFAGVLNPFLGGMNATLAKSVNPAIWVVVFTFAIAFCTSLVFALLTRQSLPDFGRLSSAPWWSCLGGLFAASYVLSMTLVADKLGASIFTGITVTVAMIVSIVLDHHGFVGFEQHRLSFMRATGGTIMIGGLVLILRS